MRAWTQLLEPAPALATICFFLILLSQTYAAPTLPDEHAEQSTEIEYYPVADATGCYYNFQHYDEGDRILTNEPCLNCTCHNRMLMCYLRVCPFTKVGANCKVEKRSDQCCPVITCPEVPVQLVTSTAPSTALGHLNEYGCSIDNLFYSDGARVPSDPENPCELCYCIRNKTACVMQQCTLNIEGCKPVFQEGVCCPVRYNCEHPDYLEGPVTRLISTTTSTTTTTTVAPTTTLQSVECFFNGQSYNDGELVKKDIPCEKCYCLKGDIVCAVQECGPTPLDKVNCTALPRRNGQCCPDTYDCTGIIEEKLTRLSSVSYEPEVTTSSIVDQEITQGPLTTASEDEAEETKKLGGETAGPEGPETVTKTTPHPEIPVTEDQRPEKERGKIEQKTLAPEIVEESTRQPVEAPKPADHATERPLQLTTGLQETSSDIQEVTESSQATEKPELEAVTKVGVETETTAKERVTIVTAITPEETTKVQEEPRKPFVEIEPAEPSIAEETPKPHVEKETETSPAEKETAKPHVIKPSVAEETTEPYVKEASKPPHEEITAKPGVEEETTEPFDEEITTKPHADEDTVKPSIEEETDKPYVSVETAKPSIEEKTAKPHVDVGTAEPSIDEGTIKPHVDDEIAKPTIEEEMAKPHIEEKTAKPVDEETAKPTESPIESITSRVSEAIESITSRVTEAVEAITTAITGFSSEGPVTKISGEKEVVTELAYEEDVTQQPEESEKETEVPEEEAVTKVIAVTEKESAFPTLASVTEQPDNLGVTSIVSDKGKPEEALESEKEKPSATEISFPGKEQPETLGTTEESVKGPITDRIIPTEEKTSLAPEIEQGPVSHEEHEGVEEEQETKAPVTKTERPGVVDEIIKPEQITESQPLATERPDTIEIPEHTEPSKEKPETETQGSGASVTHPSVIGKETTSQVPEEGQEITKEPDALIEPSQVPNDGQKTELHAAPTTEESVGETTEPTVETKTEKELIPATEETIIPQDCGEQGCVKIPAEPSLTTKQPIKEGHETEGPKKSEEEKQSSTTPAAASEQPTIEQSTPSGEHKPESDKILPSDEEPGLPKESEITEPSENITTEMEEVVIVTEIPTKKTELPESMDHVSETAYSTEAPKEGLQPIAEETGKVNLEPSSIRPEISREPGQEPTEQPAYTEVESEIPDEEREAERPELLSPTGKTQPATTKTPDKGQTEEPSTETEATKGPSKEESKEPTSATAATDRAQTLPPSEEPSSMEISKEETKEDLEGTVSQPITKGPIESTGTPSEEISQPTTEVPREEENEIEHEEPVPTVPKTEGGETKPPEEQPITEVSVPEEGIREVTTHKKSELEEQITEKAIIPEVCTSESECAPGAVPSLHEAETESNKLPEKPTTQVSAKPEEQETLKPEGTTESNKIPETEEHTEETNEIPEGGTEEIPKITYAPESVPSQEEESSGEKPKDVTTKEAEGSGHEPEEGSGFTEAAPEGPEVTETVPNLTVTEEPKERPDVFTIPPQEEGKEKEQPSETEGPESFTEQPKREQVPETRPTEYPATAEYPEGTDLPEREIPGEGSCLVDGQNYKNNSSVPPINHCQTSCKCVSSILRCESIECTPAPAGMQNCMPIFLSPDSCCPTYSCTGPETTSPMESDSHVIQTTTTAAEEPTTIKVKQVEKETEKPEIPVSTSPTEEKEREPGSTSKTAGTTEEATKLPIQPDESTQPPVAEEEVIKKQCDEFGCKPINVQPEKEIPSEQLPTEHAPKKDTEKLTEPTEGSVPGTSPEGESEKPESATTKKPQPEKVVSPSEPEIAEVTEAKLPEKEEHLTTVEPIITVKPEQGTATATSISESSTDSKPSDRITVLPEEVTQEVEPEQPTKEAETENPVESTETVRSDSVYSAKPEATTERYDARKPTEISQGPAVSTEEEEKGTPTEITKIATTEPSRKSEQPDYTEVAGVSYSALPETSTELEEVVTKGVEVVTKEEDRYKLPEEQITDKLEEEKPSEIGATEEPSVATTAESQTKLPAEETTESRRPSKKPEVVGPESTIVLEEIGKPFVTTALPEKELVPEVTTELGTFDKATKPSGEVKEAKTTEQPKKPGKPEEETETVPKLTTEQPEFPEHIITELPSLTSQSVTQIAPQSSQVTTEGEQVEAATRKEPEGQVVVKESTEKSITEKEIISKEPEEIQPETTPAPKEEEETAQDITMPPESERTGKPIESESHVTGQEPTETSPKVTEEKSTEKAIEGPSSEVLIEKLDRTTPLPSEEGKIVTEIPSEVVSLPQEESGKPDIETPAEKDKGKPTSTEKYSPTTTEKEDHKIVTKPEITESLPEEGTARPASEDKITTEGEKQLAVITEETPVGSRVTEHSSTSPSEAERTPEVPYKETTSPTVKITEKVPEGPEPEQVTSADTEGVPAQPSVTERAEEKPSQTEKITEEPTEGVMTTATEEVPTQPSITKKTEGKPSKTEKISEGPTERVTSASPEEVPTQPSVTSKAEEEPSKTEKVPSKTLEKATEIPSVDHTSPEIDIEEPLSTDESLLTNTPPQVLTKTEKTPAGPSRGTEEPSELDNEIPGTVSEKETPVASNKEPESTEQPQKEGEKPVKAAEEPTDEVEKETIVPTEGQTQVPGLATEEGTTPSSGITSSSSTAPEDEQASEKPSEDELAIHTTEKEAPVTGEIEIPSTGEEGKTTAPEDLPKEEIPKPQLEKETAIIGTKEQLIPEGSKPTKPPTEGETEMPTGPEEESKTPTAEQPVIGQTEPSRVPEEESKTLAPELPISQDTGKPSLSEEQTSEPEVVEYSTRKPSKVEEGKTTSKTTTESVVDLGKTVKPSLPEEQTSEPEVVEYTTRKPSKVEESKTTTKPEVDLGKTVKPSLPEEQTSEPEVVEYTTRKPSKVEESKTTTKPEVDLGKTVKPILSEEQTSEPEVVEYPTRKPSKVEESKTTTEPEVDLGKTGTPSLPEEQTSEPEVVEYPSVKPSEVEEGKITTEPEVDLSKTEKPSIFEGAKTPVPEQPVSEATKPSLHEEETKISEPPVVETEKPRIPEDETKTSIPEKPIVSSEEEAVTRKPLEESPVFTSPEVIAPVGEEKGNASEPERGQLYTSGPKVETTTRRHVPGELSTSAPISEPTTILPATTTSKEPSPAHIPGEQVPELPDYEQPGEEYEDEDQSAFGPGTCRYGGKVYVSAQQIPRDDPCDFCFCFRSDIICLQQSCPPPIPRCHEEPIRGFCCPRYECPVSMATAVNVTTSTTTTTTTLPPHFLAHAYKGRASKTGCQISGKAYKVGEPIRATSGPCLHCKCGGDGQMKCDPKPCSPEPMLRQMIAAAASRRRR